MIKFPSKVRRVVEYIECYITIRGQTMTFMSLVTALNYALKDRE